jgi:hypothetical protein
MKLRDAPNLPLRVLGVVTLIVFSSACEQRPPRPGNVVGEGLDAVWTGAPQPRFSTLRRVVVMRDHSDAPGDTTDTSVSTLVRWEQWRSVVHTEEHARRGPPSLTTQDEVGVFDLMEAAWTTELRARDDLWTRTISRIESAWNVEGRLFPLAVGNRLRFEIQLRQDTETPHGRLSPERTQRGYEYVVTGTTDRWARSTPAVPGRVFVIRFSMDGEIGPMVSELHYSEALGVAVFESEDLAKRDEGLTGIREVWLTEWQ